MSATEGKYNDEDDYSKELTNLFVNLRVPAIKTKEQAWVDFKTSLVAKSKVAKQRSLNYLNYAIAAGIALLISISAWLYYGSETKIWCQPAQMVTVILPDSSQVVMNAASVLKYTKRNWNKVRRVHLEGEAFFRVKKGGKFEVETQNGIIRVLGTTFNVFARNNRLEVFCETGKVAVISGNTVLLKPGMKAKTSNGSAIQVSKVEKIHERAWLQGDFWFNNAPLSEVIAEIERQFNVTIRYDDFKDRYYTGYFNRTSLNEALYTVFYPMQLNYKIEKNVIQIIK